MKAFTFDRYGKNTPLKQVDVPTPEPRDSEVLIAIHASSINQLDAKLRSGEFKLLLPYRLPLILGHDVAGKVVRVGAAVRHFKVGDAVYSRPPDFQIGAFAEFIAVDERFVALKPAALSMEDAASLPLVALTAWQALVEHAKLRAGEKVFIQAGSGGVGTIAIQLAKHLGATVATTTSGPNIELMKQLGADVVVEYRTEDFETKVRDYDVVLHSQDTKTLEKSLRVLKPRGRLVSISGPPDPTFAKQHGASWFLQLAMRMLSARVRRAARRHCVDYSFLFMKGDGEQLEEISRLVDAGAIRPIVDRVAEFDALPEALAYVESGRARGKVVVRVK